MLGPHQNWTVVLQLETPMRGECRGFAALPLVEPAQILVRAAEWNAGAYTEGLFRRIGDTLALMLPPGEAPSLCPGPRALECMARRQANCRSLLLVVTGANPLDKATGDLIQNWQRGAAFLDMVLPILPQGSAPSLVLPAPLDKLQALFRTPDPADLVPDILRAAGIGGGDRRVFISYRRGDAAALAEQIHDALARCGFRIFLDRFSGTPGRPFPIELGEELMDKAMVVVLETANLRRSPWTLAEATFAFLFRLGLIAINVDKAPGLRLIPPTDRHPVRRDPSGQLGESELADVVRFTRSTYARQVTKRRLYLESLLSGALKAHQILPQRDRDGVYRVSGGKPYKVHLAARPPRLGDARRVCASMTPGHPVIVGPHRFLPPQDDGDFHWLENELGFSLFGEEQILTAADGMAFGRIP